MSSQKLIDKAWMRESFNHAAASYDEAAVLQREVVDRLLERMDYFTIAPQTILDLGSGTGYGSAQLRKKYPTANIVELDIAEHMLSYARNKQGFIERFKGKRRPVCADAEALPFAENSFDLIFSSMSLQWCEDLDRVFEECNRVLKPGACLMFASLGPDTLKELRKSWQAVDGKDHVNTFIDMHDIGDALVRKRFANPVMDVETITLTYNSVFDLMKDLKAIGSRNALYNREHGLTGKEKLKAMAQQYETFRRDDCLPASYEIVYGHGWAPDLHLPAANKPVNDFPVKVSVVKP